MTNEQSSLMRYSTVQKLTPADLPKYIGDNEQASNFFSFTDFMRRKFREKDISQQVVFLRAELPERYGYKLISGEKRTKKRDVIIRICLAAKFELPEIQEALILYGMAPLFSTNPRDIALIVIICNQIYDIHAADSILKENNLTPLLNQHNR